MPHLHHRHRREAIDIRKADAALADISTEELTSVQTDVSGDMGAEALTSAKTDEAQLISATLLQADEAIDDTADAYTDAITYAMHTPHLSDILSPYSIALLHPHRPWPVHPECPLHLCLCFISCSCFSFPRTCTGLSSTSLWRNTSTTTSTLPQVLTYHLCISMSSSTSLASSLSLATSTITNPSSIIRLRQVHLPQSRYSITSTSSSTCWITPTSTASSSWFSRSTPAWVAIRVRYSPLWLRPFGMPRISTSSRSSRSKFSTSSSRCASNHLQHRTKHRNLDAHLPRQRVRHHDLESERLRKGLEVSLYIMVIFKFVIAGIISYFDISISNTSRFRGV